MLHSNNWPNFIVWLLLLLEILSNIFITIVCQPGCDVIKFEINLIFLIKLKYLENEKSFWREIKNIFYHFDFQLPKIVSDLRVRL